MFAKLFRDHGSSRRARGKRGFSILELLFVIGISITIAAIALPNFMTAYYNIQLKAAATDLSSLMQKARIQAARLNSVNAVYYQLNGTVEEAYVDLNNSASLDNGQITVNGVQMREPVIDFNQQIRVANGAPSGGGAPPPYVLVGDTAGVTYTNPTVLGWSARGLPCAYAANVCTTPAGGYFVYYLRDRRRPASGGWAAVIVTRSGRTKISLWSGTAWE